MLQYRAVYPETLELLKILKSLTYFDDAEEEFDPISLNNTNWEEVNQILLIKSVVICKTNLCL